MEWLKSTSGQIQDGGRRPNCKFLNRYNSAADCPILLKSVMWMDNTSREVVIKAENDWLDERPQVPVHR